MLRDVRAKDYPLLAQWQNDEEVAHWMDYRTPFTVNDVAIDQERASAEGRPYVIELDGRPIGKCGLNQFRWDTGACALYIYLGEKDTWGRGLGREVVVELLRIAFHQMGAGRVELTMIADNSRARRTYEACGFAEEKRLAGRSYRAGRYYDTTIMSVDRETFEKLVLA